MGSKFSAVRQNLMQKHLFVTNVVTTGGLLAAGDAITQNLEIAMDKEGTQKYSLQRTSEYCIDSIGAQIRFL